MPVNEKALIAEIHRMALASSQRQVKANVRASRSAAIVTGIGDDCAALRVPPGLDMLVTTDFSLEGIHFRRDWHSAEAVGHRCLARGLSDIAAMGGKPVAAFLSLALPRNLPQAWVRRFMHGLIELANQFGVTLAGGDTAESPSGVLADIIVVGTVPKGKTVLRSGARGGDGIFVSGQLGGSAAAVRQMRKKPKTKLNLREYPGHFLPQPRIEVGHFLRARGLATSMIDTSDGLSTDLAHLCEESGVGAEVEAGLVPRARVGKPGREVDIDLALHGGEDYELLFTAPATVSVPLRIAGVPIKRIGNITRRRKIYLMDRDGGRQELQPQGWEHFRH